MRFYIHILAIEKRILTRLCLSSNTINIEELLDDGFQHLPSQQTLQCRRNGHLVG